MWGVLMAFCRCCRPWACLIWGPVAIHFLATGATGQAAILGLWHRRHRPGDNPCRPLLVGKGHQRYRTWYPDLPRWIPWRCCLTNFVIGPVITALFIATWGCCPAEDSRSSQSRATRAYP